MRSEYERIDDLYVKNYKIIQDRRYFCFGVDAVLLAHFARVRKADRVLELGCGNGVISLLTAARYEPRQVVAVEILKEMAELAQRNVALNGEEGRIRVICGDLRECEGFLVRNTFDAVICNPPYKEAGGGLPSEKKELLIARHEIMCTLEDVIIQASRMLKVQGRLYLIQRPQRIPDMLVSMRRHKIEPKSIRLVFPKPEAPPLMVLAEGRYCGKPDFAVLSPLYITDHEGRYTKEIEEIYQRGVFHGNQ